MKQWYRPLLTLLAMWPGLSADSYAQDAITGVGADDPYHPPQLQWHPVETLYQTAGLQQGAVVQPDADGPLFTIDAKNRGFLPWSQGRYLRLRFRDKPTADLEIWTSPGDGLYRKLQATTRWQASDGSWQWLLDRGKSGSGMAMIVNNRSEAAKFFAFHSRLRKAPGSLTTPGRFSSAHHSDLFGLSPGLRFDNLSQTNPRQPLTVELEGPQIYVFEWRTAWRASYGQAQKMELNITLDDGPAEHRLVEMTSSRSSSLTNDSQACAYSGTSRLLYQVPAGRHRVTITPDRAIAGVWKSLKSDIRFFYPGRNMPGLQSSLPLQARQSAEEADQQSRRYTKKPGEDFYQPAAPALLKHFYRSLHPRQATVLTPLAPMAVESGDREVRSVAAPGKSPPIKPAWFFSLDGGTSLNFDLPYNSVSPPLRLNIPWDMPAGKFALVTDAGERHEFHYLPYARLDGWRLSIRSSLALQQGSTHPATAIPVVRRNLLMTNKFNSLKWVNLGAARMQGSLAYRNTRPAETDEDGFITATQNLGQSQLLTLLTGPATSTQPLTLFHQEMASWRQRMSNRIEQVHRLLPSAAGSQSAPDLRAMYQQLSGVSGQTINSLRGAVGYLDSRGHQTKSRRLLLLLALHSTDPVIAKHAESLLLERLSEDQDWDTTEGYWSYRLVEQRDPRAYTALGNALFRQNRFDSAAKWYLLASRFSDTDTVPAQALLAAAASGYDETLGLLVDPVSEHYRAWRCLITAGDECATARQHLSRRWQYWKSSRATVAHGSLAWMENQASGAFFPALRSSPTDPAVLKIRGPARLRLSVYVQREAGQPWSNSDWLQVGLDRRTQRYLIEKPRDSISIHAAADEDAAVASPQRVVLDIPAGSHQLTLALQQHNALIAVHQQHELVNELWSAVQQRSEHSLSPSLQTLFHPVPLASQVCAQTRVSDSAPARDVLALPRGGRQDPTPAIDNAQTDAGQILAQLRKIKRSAGEGEKFRVYELLLKLAGIVTQDGSWLDHISAANAAAAPFTEDAEVARLLDTLNHEYRWKRTTEVVSSKGSHRIPRDRWTPISEYQRIEKALLSEAPEAGEYRLTRRSKTIQLDHIDAGDTVDIHLRAPRSVGLSRSARTVRLEIAGEERLTSVVSGEPQTVSLRLDSGRHYLTISATDDRGTVVLYSVRSLASGKSLLPPTFQGYHSASEENPLVVFVPENSWVRVDRLLANDRIDTRYQFQSGNDFLRLTPPAAGTTAQFRVSRWQPLPNPSPKQAPLTDAPLYVNTYDIWPTTGIRGLYPYDRYPLGSRSPGTWGVDAGIERRSNFDEDEATDTENFIQLGLSYRRRLDDLSSYTVTKAFLRQHEDRGLSTLGASHTWQWRPSQYWNVSAGTSGYYQLAADDGLAEQEWSLLFRLASTWNIYFNDTWKNRVRLSGFQRHLSIDQKDAPEAVDNDVYTNYKATHRNAVRLGDELIYRPWLDTELSIGASIASNEHLGSVDNIAFQAGVAQYFRPFVLDLELRQRNYRADGDRRRDSDQTQLRFNFHWDQWRQNGNLWQTRLSLKHDFDEKDTAAALTFGWNLTQGRGFEDFSPSHLAFPTLRRRDAYNALETNRLIDIEQ